MCPSGCGPLYKPGIDLRDTTCPCGFGYFDRSGLFVAGDHVRSGQAVSRESHATHPRSCPLEADPRNRNTESEFSDAGGQSGGFRDYFMPGTGIDLEMLKIYVARDGPMGTVRPTEFHVIRTAFLAFRNGANILQGQSGYLIHAKQMPTVVSDGIIYGICNSNVDRLRCRNTFQTSKRTRLKFSSFDESMVAECQTGLR